MTWTAKLSDYRARVTALSEADDEIYVLHDVWVTASGLDGEFHVRLPAGKAPRIGDILHFQLSGETDTPQDAGS
jgi:hypothetical protein